MAATRNPTPLRTPALLVLMLLGTTGCGKDKKQVSEAALLLCKYNQIEAPTPEMLPDGVSIASVVRSADLLFLAKKKADEQAGLEGNPFAGLAQVMEAAVTPLGKATVEAAAGVTDCAVTEIQIQGDRATAQLSRTVPAMDNSQLTLDKIGEINRLGTHQERVARIEEWYATATSTSTTQHDLRFQREGDSWVAVLGLPEARLGEIQGQISELQAKAQAMEEKRNLLAQFEVTSAEYSKKKMGWGLVNVILDLQVKNGNTQPVSRAYFHGVIQSPGRSVPWVEEDFNYQIPGGIEPGETAHWRLNPNMFSAWGTVDVPRDAVFTVTVVRLDGADGEAIASVSDADDVAQQMAELSAEAEAIRTSFLE